MKTVTGARCHLWFLIVALLGLAGLVSAQSDPSKHHFDLDDVQGRYVSAENAFDVSSVHANGSLVGPPIFFATAEVMVADGKGNVCGEVDGFYSGIDAPGVDLGPSFFYGTYAVDANGRITITIWGTTAFCASPAPPAGAASASSVQVGYLQDKDGKKIVTVSQTGFGTDPDSSGFLVHKHVWTRGEREHEHERERH